MKRLFVAALLVLAMVGYADAQAQAQTGNEETKCADGSVFFCENWEDYATGPFATTTPPHFKNPGWALSAPGSGQFQVVTSQRVDGTKSLQAFWPGPASGGPFMDLLDFAGGPWTTIYIRWYERWSGNSQFGVIGGKNVEMRTIGAGGATLFPITTSGDGTYGNGFAGLLPADIATIDPVAGTRLGYPANMNGVFHIAGDTWYCFEVRFTLPTTNNPFGGVGNGYVQGWVNDVQHWEYPNTQLLATGGARVENILISAYYNCVPDNDCLNGNPANAHPDQYRWHDNFIVSSQRIGCLGAAPPPTPPAAPTNLRFGAVLLPLFALLWALGRRISV